MIRVDSDHCPACDRTTKIEFLYTVNFHRIYRCTDCGIGRTEVADFDPLSYYSEEYFSGGRSDGYADYAGSHGILRKEFRKLVGVVRALTSGHRLLEVGCAYGFFLEEARRHFDVTGIEISDAAADACRDSGLNVINAELTRSALEPLGQFDAIVLLDVIEHLPDATEAFRLFDLHLNPGGIVLLTTGDFASFTAKRAGKRWRLMTPPQHLWFFTPDSIRLLAGCNRLTVESVEHPWKLVPLSLIGFQLRRFMHLPGGPFSLPSVGVPVNLFDAMRVVLRKKATNP